MLKRHCLATAALAVLLGSATAQADPITYSSEASFSGATTALITTTIPDPAPLQLINFGTPVGDPSVTYDGVNYSAITPQGTSAFFNIGSLFSGEPAVISDQNSVAGQANITITLPTAVTAFSLDYGTFDGNNVTFLLSNGDQVTQGSTGSAYSGSGYSVPDFLGVTDSTPFTSITVTSSDPVLNVNGIVYGSAVPEPSSLTLCGLAALMGLGFLRSRGNRIAG